MRMEETLRNEKRNRKHKKNRVDYMQLKKKIFVKNLHQGSIIQSRTMSATWSILGSFSFFVFR